MKKSIVLFITLLFITAISALIAINLKDTHRYLDKQNHKLNRTQILSLVKNVQEEFKKILTHSNKDDILTKTRGISQVFPLKDFFIEFTHDNYDKTYIKNNDKMKDLFNSEDIANYEVFKEIVDKYSTIISNKQVDDIISKFKETTYDKKIDEIKDKIGIINVNDKPFFTLDINIKYLNETITAKYILNDTGGVKDFELSFK